MCGRVYECAWITLLHLGSLPPNFPWLILKVVQMKPTNLQCFVLFQSNDAHPSTSKPSVKQSLFSFVQKSWEINCR